MNEEVKWNGRREEEDKIMNLSRWQRQQRRFKERHSYACSSSESRSFTTN